MEIMLHGMPMALSDALIAQIETAMEDDARSGKSRAVLVAGFQNEGWTAAMFKAPTEKEIKASNDRLAKWQELKALAAVTVSVNGKRLAGTDLTTVLDTLSDPKGKVGKHVLGVQIGGRSTDPDTGMQRGTWNGAFTSQIATWRRWMEAAEKDGAEPKPRETKTTRQYITTRIGEIVKRLALDMAKTEPDASLSFPLADAGKFEKALADTLVRFGFTPKECGMSADVVAALPAPVEGKAKAKRAK